MTLIHLDSLSPSDKNPRYITEDSFHSLQDSLLSFPEMLEARGLVIAGKKTAGSNQRLRAIKAIVEAGYEVAEARIDAIIQARNNDAKAKGKPLPYPPKRVNSIHKIWKQVCEHSSVPESWVLDMSEWTPSMIEEFTIKDNVSSGNWDWDSLANGWDSSELKGWGVSMPFWPEENEAGEDQPMFQRREEDSAPFYAFSFQYKTAEEYELIKLKLSQIDENHTKALFKLCSSI